jgi:hypothetical protein
MMLLLGLGAPSKAQDLYVQNINLKRQTQNSLFSAHEGMAVDLPKINCPLVPQPPAFLRLSRVIPNRPGQAAGSAASAIPR